jgi:hypothetical protein
MFSSGVNLGGGGNAGGSGVAGANTQIQYNNSGMLGASANFTWDELNKRLQLAGNNSSIQLGTVGNLRISEVVGSGIDLGSYGVSGYRVRFVDNSIVHASFGANSYVFGGATATAGSVLVDFQSTTLGIVFPRAARASIVTPVNGMFTVDANLPYFHNGSNWSRLHFRGDNILVSQNSGAFLEYTNAGNTLTYVWESGIAAAASIGGFTQAITLPSTIPNNSTVCFEINVLGITPATGATGYYLKYLFAFRKDNAGTWTQIGSITTVIAVADAPYVPAAPTFSIAGTNLTCNINFTGAVVSRNYTLSVRLRTGQ